MADRTLPPLLVPGTTVYALDGGPATVIVDHGYSHKNGRRLRDAGLQIVLHADNVTREVQRDQLLLIHDEII